MSKLFSPARIGPYQLSHRVVMAPLTRMRSDLERFPLFVNRKDSQRAANKILWPSRAEEAGNGVFERFASSSDSGC